MARRLPLLECYARELTMSALLDAGEQLEPGSVEGIFVMHAATHCIECWLSESFGHPVRISAWFNDGVEVTRCG